jgi:hypothetical protein
VRRDWKVEHRLRGEARDCFIRAAASLTEMPTEENVGFAVFNGALGMMRLAESDTENRVLDRVLGILAKVKASRAQRLQQPWRRERERTETHEKD